MWFSYSVIFLISNNTNKDRVNTKVYYIGFITNIHCTWFCYTSCSYFCTIFFTSCFELLFCRPANLSSFCFPRSNFARYYTFLRPDGSIFLNIFFMSETEVKPLPKISDLLWLRQLFYTYIFLLWMLFSEFNIIPLNKSISQ